MCISTIEKVLRETSIIESAAPIRRNRARHQAA
jgi:hypothetical protein